MTLYICTIETGFPRETPYKRSRIQQDLTECLSLDMQQQKVLLTTRPHKMSFLKYPTTKGPLDIHITLRTNRSLYRIHHCPCHSLQAQHQLIPIMTLSPESIIGLLSLILNLPISLILVWQTQKCLTHLRNEPSRNCKSPVPHNKHHSSASYASVLADLAPKRRQRTS
jgi:hypothetical protein